MFVHLHVYVLSYVFVVCTFMCVFPCVVVHAKLRVVVCYCLFVYVAEYMCGPCASPCGGLGGPVCELAHFTWRGAGPVLDVSWCYDESLLATCGGSLSHSLYTDLFHCCHTLSSPVFFCLSTPVA